MRLGRAISLPMYDWPEARDAHGAFFYHLKSALRSAGFDPSPALIFPDDLDTAWTSPDLLLSQTCGYPLATRLAGAVTPFARPVYNVEGCGEGTYCSFIVARASGLRLDDVSGLRLAINSRDSLSGYRCLTPLFGDPERAFLSVLQTGSHRLSARAVARGEADLAAIDAVCLHFLRRFEPATAAELHTIGQGETYPALPFIAARTASADQGAALYEALKMAVSAANRDETASVLALNSVIPASFGDFSALSTL